MSLTTSQSAAKWLNDVVHIMDTNQCTFLDLLSQLLRYGHAFTNLAPHRAVLLSSVKPVIALEDSKMTAGRFMTEVYRNELLQLVDKQQGFHFGAKTATLEQLENFTVDQLGQSMHNACPLLSNLLITLLDANSVQRRHTQPEEKKQPSMVDEMSEDEDEDEESDEDWEDSSIASSDSSDSEDAGVGESDSDSDVSMSSVSEQDAPPGTVHQQEGKTQKRRTQNAARRNRLLITIKHVLIIAILGHSTNQLFNSFQCHIGFFLESKQAPEIITELLAHMGISVSSGSLHNMVKSLSKQARRRLKSLPHSNTTYDNLDFDFQKGQPTAENTKQHLSITAGAFSPYKNIDHDRDLQ